MGQSRKKLLVLVLPKLKMEQTISKPKGVMTHGNATNINGHLVQCHMEQYQLEVDVGTQFYWLPHGRISGWKMDLVHHDLGILLIQTYSTTLVGHAGYTQAQGGKMLNYGGCHW